jgi:hypothetical protein
VKLKYKFIRTWADSLPVRGLCAYLGVSQSGYYDWLNREPSQRAQEDQHLGDLIETEFHKHRCAYGSARMCDRLRQLGRRHERRRVSRESADGSARARCPENEAFREHDGGRSDPVASAQPVEPCVHRAGSELQVSVGHHADPHR